MYERILDLRTLARERSLFLFGPRQTGKTTLLKRVFPDATYYNLLKADTFRDLTARPELIRKSLTGHESLVVVDEIQRFAPLLNEIQVMIDDRPSLRFILTGSSARSLRRGGTNLLGGRARVATLHPLVSPELDFGRLEERLTIGSLPAILDAKEPQADLKAYVGTYLQEEIRAEGLVRSMDNFSRFLETAALTNGQVVNFTKVGADTGVPPRTIREHYQILEDTLVGSLLPAFQGTKKRKATAAARFYFFDVGVANHLMNRHQVLPGSPEFGSAMEHLVYCELRAWLAYRRVDLPLTFWRSWSQIEVDFLVGRDIAVDVKSSRRVSERDLKPLRYLAEEIPLKHRIVVCREEQAWRSDDGIEVLPVDLFLRRLWADEFMP